LSEGGNWAALYAEEPQVAHKGDEGFHTGRYRGGTNTGALRKQKKGRGPAKVSSCEKAPATLAGGIGGTDREDTHIGGVRTTGLGPPSSGGKFHLYQIVIETGEKTGILPRKIANAEETQRGDNSANAKKKPRWRLQTETYPLGKAL